MKKRLLGICLTVVMMFALAAGCSGTGESEDEEVRKASAGTSEASADQQKELTIVTLNEVAFAEGQGDFTVEFEPNATSLENEGKGFVVASLGTDSGYVPYTAFSAKQSYIEENPEIIQGVTNALQKGMDYVQNHAPEEIAKVIEPQFTETDLETITTIVTRYYDQDTWKENLIFEEESFELLQDILEEAGELTKRAPYEDLVTTEYAERAAE